MSELSLQFGSSLVDELEDECYLRPEFNSFFQNNVKSRIEEFSSWFNSTARLYLLRCRPEESEIFIYLLLNLKKKLKEAISEINSSVSREPHTYHCNLCDEAIQVQPWQNAWKVLQDHPHFEQVFTQPRCLSENSAISNSSYSEEDATDSEDAAAQSQLQGLNDFRFNFVITYDSRVEEALYPQNICTMVQSHDKLSDFSIQKSGVNRGTCLLCCCSIVTKGRCLKIKPYVVKNHVMGHKHMKLAKTSFSTNALKEYHEFWKAQEPNYQAHQVHFVPEVSRPSTCRCSLCMEIVPYGWIIRHINDLVHKTRVLNVFASVEGKLNEFYLMDMQVGVYCDVPVNHAVVKEATIKNEKIAPAPPPPPPKCVIVKSVTDWNSINLPPRFQNHTKLLSKEGDLIDCKACKMRFGIKGAKQHVLTAQHKQLSGVPYPNYKFFCEICHLNFKDEGSWDDHFIKGPNRHDKMSENRKLKTAEYECKTCMTIIFGDEISLSRHITSRENRNKRNKEVRLPPSLKKNFISKAFIKEEARRLVLEAMQVLEDQQRMTDCCDALQRALSSLYSGCLAYPFGSRISGLGTKQSDLDVFMDTGGMYLGERFQDSQSQEQFVKKVTKQLKQCKDFIDVFPIPSARTPIVKLRHIHTALDCDISFRHGLGVENTQFLRFCIELEPVTQPLILLLKKWSDCCKLNEHITNYGLALMAIFFLQTKGHLCSVKTMRTYYTQKALVIDGWETISYTVPVEGMKHLVTPYVGDVPQLLRDFFYYYSKFDYPNQVVCPLLGQTVPKLWFNDRPNGESLPKEMSSYVLRIQVENGEQFRSLSPFCIQDPFDLSHNLTKACQPGTINKLKALCTLTYELLDSIE